MYILLLLSDHLRGGAADEEEFECVPDSDDGPGADPDETA